MGLFLPKCGIEPQSHAWLEFSLEGLGKVTFPGKEKN